MKNKEKVVSLRTATVVLCLGNAGALSVAPAPAGCRIGPVRLICPVPSTLHGRPDASRPSSSQPSIFASPMRCPLLFQPKSSLHHEFKPDSGQFKPKNVANGDLSTLNSQPRKLSASFLPRCAEAQRRRIAASKPATAGEDGSTRNIHIKPWPPILFAGNRD